MAESLRTTRIMVVNAPKATPVEPTFYLGGQAYIFEEAELVKAGPEFAEMAFYETWRELWRMLASMGDGTLSRPDFEHRSAELYEGAASLRRHIPRTERLVPNGHFTQVH